MDESFLTKLYLDHQECPKCPSPQKVEDFFTDLLGTLFPNISKSSFSSRKDLSVHFDRLQVELDKMIIVEPSKTGSKNFNVAEDFFLRIPAIHKKIEADITAMFKGDPAAKSRGEVIRTYPGFYAISAYRIANELHKMSVPIIPRMITEHAHGKTGIDIHPAANIGEHFCIDHGTGVVIGETTVIGDHVKIYQGVTLGALSVDKADAEIKRHPTISNHVVIYAGATILGGETIIGERSVIGGNVWITRSVPSDTKIYYQAKMFNSNTDQTDLYIYKEN